MKVVLQTKLEETRAQLTNVNAQVASTAQTLDGLKNLQAQLVGRLNALTEMIAEANEKAAQTAE